MDFNFRRLVKDLKKDFELTDYEACDLVIKLQQKDMLERKLNNIEEAIVNVAESV